MVWIRSTRNHTSLCTLCSNLFAKFVGNSITLVHGWTSIATIGWTSERLFDWNSNVNKLFTGVLLANVLANTCCRFAGPLTFCPCTVGLTFDSNRLETINQTLLRVGRRFFHPGVDTRTSTTCCSRIRAALFRSRLSASTLASTLAAALFGFRPTLPNLRPFLGSTLARGHDVGFFFFPSFFFKKRNIFFSLGRVLEF